MNGPDWMTWFRGWLARHPLKHPPMEDAQAYTEEVMTQIRVVSHPHPVRSWRLVIPRLAWAAGALAMGVVIVNLVQRPAPTRLAREVERDWTLLAQLGEPVEEPAAGLEEDLHTLDEGILLAEGPTSLEEEAWVNDTLRLLNELDEETNGEGDGDDLDHWLEELQQLDEAELTAS